MAVKCGSLATANVSWKGKEIVMRCSRTTSPYQKLSVNPWYNIYFSVWWKIFRVESIIKIEFSGDFLMLKVTLMPKDRMVYLQLFAQGLWCMSSAELCVCAQSLQSCLTLCDLIDRSSPGSSVYRILQARILEWVPTPFSRGSSQLRDRTCISRAAGRFFTAESAGDPLWG